VAEAGLDYEISTLPLQALGTIHGRGFYFLAKHSNWSFEVEDDLGSLPSDTGGNPVFQVNGRYPHAGEMTTEEAARIIERCAALFIEIGKP
jgi:hypothetical protein